MKNYIIYILLLTISKVDLFFISKTKLCLISQNNCNKITNNYHYIKSFRLRNNNNDHFNDDHFNDDNFNNNKKYDNNVNVTTYHNKVDNIDNDDDNEYTYVNTLWVIFLLIKIIVGK